MCILMIFLEVCNTFPRKKNPLGDHLLPADLHPVESHGEEAPPGHPPQERLQPAPPPGQGLGLEAASAQAHQAEAAQEAHQEDNLQVLTRIDSKVDFGICFFLKKAHV